MNSRTYSSTQYVAYTVLNIGEVGIKAIPCGAGVLAGDMVTTQWPQTGAWSLYGDLCLWIGFSWV